jgi:signal transduction histidine kinase
MINDLLSVERLESGTFSLDKERVSFKQLCDGAVESIRAIAEEAGVSIIVEPYDLYIYCDGERIIRVLTNLLSNAIKFSPERARIELRARKTENATEISVTDYGPGISESNQHIIFERFKQISRGDESIRRGSGLGLPICKAIVEAHGGSISVKSALGEGSTFAFNLPDPNC